jgi:excisionase family DNA binding protein
VTSVPASRQVTASDLYIALADSLQRAAALLVSIASQQPAAPFQAPLTFVEAGKRMGVSGRSVERIVAEGNLAVVEVGKGAKRIPVAAIEKYMRLRTKTVGPRPVEREP